MKLFFIGFVHRHLEISHLLSILKDSVLVAGFVFVKLGFSIFVDSRIVLDIFLTLTNSFLTSIIQFQSKIKYIQVVLVHFNGGVKTH